MRFRATMAFIVIVLCSAGALAEEGVAARVNGAVITAKDIEDEVNRMIPRLTYHSSVSEERRGEFRKTALETLIDQELQYQDAVSRGLKPDKGRVNDQMKQSRDRYNSKKEYQAALERAGLTEERLRARIERGAIIEAARARVVDEPSRMSEEALKDYYGKNLDKFMQPESVHLRVISTSDEKKAKDVYARVRGGEDFGDLAAAMSDDKYRIRGGDAGYIHRGRMLSPVDEAAFKLKPGAISDLILADGIWFIIKVEDRKPGHQLSFDEIRESLKKDLEKKKSKELMDQWLAELKAKAKIERLTVPQAAEKEEPAADKGQQRQPPAHPQL